MCLAGHRPDPGRGLHPKRPVSFVNLAGWSGERKSFGVRQGAEFEVPAKVQRS